MTCPPSLYRQFALLHIMLSQLTQQLEYDDAGQYMLVFLVL